MPHLLLLLLTACSALTLATRSRSWPEVSGEVRAEGIAAGATIYRDVHGIPHIRAGSEADAFYALGWAHAQDRLFQMDAARRYGRGRLAEWFGEGLVDLDAMMQALRLEHFALESLKAADPETRFLLAAYAAGVNGAATSGELPIEHRLLGAAWEPWTPADSLIVSALQAWALAGQNDEVAALALRGRLDAKKLDALFAWSADIPPIEPGWAQVAEARIGPFRPEAVRFLGTVATPQPEASNAWAIGPSLSADGAPIVANDPHLGVSMPAHWTLAELHAGELHVAGATIPGLPAFATGHNEHVAWGATNTMADTVDYAVLRREGERGVVVAGQVEELEPVQVHVEVRDGEPVERTFWWSSLGPVLTELDAPHVVVLQWTAFHTPDLAIDQALALARAASVEEVVAARADRPSLVSLHLVVGDDQGHIGAVITGALPRRKAHTGRVPYLASDPEQGWDGWLDPVPPAIDPEAGFVVAANARPGWLEPEQANAISAVYAPGWRLERIRQLIAAREAHSLETVQRDQLDQLDLRAKALVRPWVGGVRPDTAAGKTCREILMGWDHVARPDSPAPLVWAVFQEKLLEQAVTDELGEHGLKVYEAATTPASSVLSGRTLFRFLPNQDLGVRRALDAACTELQERFGPYTSAWSWGEHHPLVFEHPFASRVPRGEETWSLRAPYGGTISTVNPGGWSWVRDDWDVRWSASLRIVTPLSDPGRARAILPTGQSGHPGHPHYGDQFPKFLAGETIPLHFHDHDVTGNAVDTLVLRP